MTILFVFNNGIDGPAIFVINNVNQQTLDKLKSYGDDYKFESKVYDEIQQILESHGAIRIEADFNPEYEVVCVNLK